MPYWSTATAIKVYTASTYGTHQTVVAPTLSSTSSATPNLTIVSPKLIIRGSSTYLSSANWAKITDIRRQYII
jgi:glycine/serine hydroxymethyltransferase